MGKNDCKLTKEQNKKLNYILFVNFYYSISLVRLQWKPSMAAVRPIRIY